jgi:ABC-type Fe2+-enterobactin transport system substrate-binding protein
MSKQLAEQKQVYSFLQKSLDNQSQQNQAMQVMLQKMMDIEVNVEEKFEQMTGMVQEVRDSVVLMNGECTMLQSEVATKSNKLAKDRYNEAEGKFSKVVGIYRRTIWKSLKDKYDVPKYNCIRRIDFEDAMGFVQDFRPEDYM